MASRDLNTLTPATKEKALLVLDLCKQADFDLLIYCTLRSLQEQAKLYRQSRSRNEINVKIEKFKNRGYQFLADIIEEVGPSNGPHRTNAGPGESWHNYAEAWDAVPLINGKAAWNYSDAKDQWDAYGDAVRQVGMNWAGDWTTFKELPHAQMRTGGSPLRSMNPDQIRGILKQNGLI